jgi:hypothetical protein
MNFLETLEISQYTMITNHLARLLFELIGKYKISNPIF